MTTEDLSLVKSNSQRKLEKKCRIILQQLQQRNQQLRQQNDLMKKHNIQKRIFCISINIIQLLALFLTISRLYIVLQTGD
jgi:hypothetical protein